MRTAGERFAGLTGQIDANGCKPWDGCLNSRGYGCFAFGGKGKNVLAHRWAYEQARGPIPKGMAIDHLCRNRRCVNPEHMEPVTPVENVMRGMSPPAINARKTHCQRGHELSGLNLLIKADGKRNCRRCLREHLRVAA